MQPSARQGSRPGPPPPGGRTTLRSSDQHSFSFTFRPPPGPCMCKTNAGCKFRPLLVRSSRPQKRDRRKESQGPGPCVYTSSRHGRAPTEKEDLVSTYRCVVCSGHLARAALQADSAIASGCTGRSQSLALPAGERKRPPGSRYIWERQRCSSVFARRLRGIAPPAMKRNQNAQRPLGSRWHDARQRTPRSAQADLGSPKRAIEGCQNCQRAIASMATVSRPR